MRRIDAIFDLERDINHRSPEQRRAARAAYVRPLVDELEAWRRRERARISRHNDLSRTVDYMLKCWPAFTRLLGDGQICMNNKAAERALRGIALGRRAQLFAGSDRGGERAADVYSLIVKAELNNVGLRTWLVHLLRTIADHPASRLDQSLP